MYIQRQFLTLVGILYRRDIYTVGTRRDTIRKDTIPNKRPLYLGTLYVGTRLQLRVGIPRNNEINPGPQSVFLENLLAALNNLPRPFPHGPAPATAVGRTLRRSNVRPQMILYVTFVAANLESESLVSSLFTVIDDIVRAGERMRE